MERKPNALDRRLYAAVIQLTDSECEEMLGLALVRLSSRGRARPARQWLALGGWWPVQPVANDQRHEQLTRGHPWRRVTDGIIFVEMLEPRVLG